jgi:hypothetical protein
MCNINTAPAQMMVLCSATHNTCIKFLTAYMAK